MPKKKMPKLVLPSVKYKKSFLEDFSREQEIQFEYKLTEIPQKDVPKKFPLFIKKLKQQSKGVLPKKGLVPQTVYWLVEDKKFLGDLSIRHVLNKKLRLIGGHIGYYVRPDERGKGFGRLILKLGLKKAKSLGIKNALLTCDVTNLRSKKVIEANGGKFDGKVKVRGMPLKARYWIKT